MNFNMKRNDLLPTLALQLINPNGEPADLTGATVVFNMAGRSATAKVSRGQVTVVDAATGQVEYHWQPGDTDDAGVFRAEFEVIYPVDQPMTYPNSDFFVVTILADLA